MKKGIFFTIDALFALFLGLLFLSFILPSNSSIHIPSSDTLFVLHASNDILNQSAVELYLDSRYDRGCAQFFLYDSFSSMIFNHTVSGCESPLTAVHIFRRTIVSDGIYYAELRLW